MAREDERRELSCAEETKKVSTLNTKHANWGIIYHTWLWEIQVWSCMVELSARSSSGAKKSRDFLSSRAVYRSNHFSEKMLENMI